MRLSDMNNYQLYDALHAIVKPLYHMLRDKELKLALDALDEEASAEAHLEYLREVIIEFVPVLHQRYREDCFAILSALTENSVEDIQQTPDNLISIEMQELIDDAMALLLMMILIFGQDEILAALCRYGPPHSIDALFALLRVQNRERHLIASIAEVMREKVNLEAI